MTVRETTEYQNSNGTVVEVHEVTADTEGGVHLTGVGNQEVKKGDVLVRDNANSWTRVNDLSGLKKVSAGKASRAPRKSTKDTPKDESTEDSNAEYNPADHTVGEVNEYLESADDAEYDRVIAAERDGQARLGILNGR